MHQVLAGSVDQAVELLAGFAVDRRARDITYREKAASGDWLASLGSAAQANPALAASLVGGGLGAAAGGVHNAITNRGKPEGQRKSLLSSVVGGGLAGAGLGAGAGLAHSGVQQLRNAAPGGDVKPGLFTDPATGQKMQIDPKSLRDNPDLHETVKRLTAPNLQTQIAGGAAGAIDFLRNQVPITGTAALGVGAADALAHNPLFGLSRIRPGQAGGTVGRELFQHGMDKLEDLPEQVRKALGKNSPLGGTRPGGDAASGYTPGTFIETKDRFQPGGAVRRLLDGLKAKVGLRPNPPGIADALGRRSGPGEGSREVATVEFAPESQIERTHKDPHDPTITSKTKETQVGKPETKAITEGHVGRAKMFGHGAHPEFKGRQLYKTFGKTYAGAKSLPAAVGGRVAAYGLPMLGEYVGRGLAEEARNKETLRELMARHAKPVTEGK